MIPRHLASLRPILALFFASEHRRVLLLGAWLSVAAALTGVALLGVAGWFIVATALAGLSLAAALSFNVFMPSAAIRFLALARTGARYGERLFTHDATLAVLAGLRERLFRGWAEANAARSLLLRPARLLFRLTVDVDALDSLYLRILVPTLTATCAALAIAVVFGGMHPLFGLVAGLVLLSATLGIPLLAARAALRPARRQAHILEVLRARTIDLVQGQTELAMAGQLHAQQQAIALADRRLADADERLHRIDTAVGAVFGIAGAALLAGTLVVVAILAQRGTIGAPVAAMALLLAFAAAEPLKGLRRGALEWGRTLLAARRLGPRLAAREVGPRLQTHAANADGYASHNTHPEPQDGFALRLARVDAVYPDAATPALHEVCLELQPRERVALIGKSGAGKSTLLSLVAGELPIREGILQTQTATLLTQRTELFQDTLRGNLTLAAPAADDDRLLQALEAAGLRKDVDASPRGLDTRLGEGGLGMSGGQSRRLALARLFLRDTPLWLLDEPTDGLDRHTAQDVLTRLKEQAENRTLLIATHIRREAEIADRLLVLAAGRIVREEHRGTPGFEAALARLRPD